MDLSQYVLLAAVIAGVTELISRLRARDYWVAATITCSAVIGALFGFFHLGTVPSVEVGVAAGFAASGALTALGIVGNRSTPQPSSAVNRSK